MKIIAAIQILIKLFTIGYGAGAVRTTGRFTAPAAAGKRADTCGFYPLNSRFPLFPNPAQTRDRRPLRKRGTTEDFSSHKDGPTSGPSFSFTYSQFGYPTATHIGYSAQARHDSVAQFVSLEITDSTCEDKLCQTDRFAGAFRYNVPKNCATRLCRACVDSTVCVAVRCL